MRFSASLGSLGRSFSLRSPTRMNETQAREGLISSGVRVSWPYTQSCLCFQPNTGLLSQEATIENREHSSFLALPTELIQRVLLCLDYKSVLACAATCSHLHDVIRSAVEFQYKLELAAAGMYDGPVGPLPVKTRLQSLRAHRTAWDKLAWTHVSNAPFGAGGNIWDLCGGVFAQGNMPPSGRRFHFFRPPSRAQGRTEPESWEFPDIECKARDFTFDTNQDVMLLIDECSWPLRVHVRSLTTNVPHKLSRKPAVFEYQRPGALVPGVFQHESFYIQIMGELFGVLRMVRSAVGLDRFPSEFVIGNWQTLDVICAVYTPDVIVECFSFLGPTQFLLSVSGNIDGNDFRPRLDVYEFQRQRDPTSGEAVPPTPTLARTYRFPALAEGVHVFDFLARSDPAPGATPPGWAKSRPYFTAPNDRILCVTLLMQRLMVQESFTLIAPFTFLSSGPTDGRVFEWHEWGPENSRFLKTPYQGVWVCYVYGSRYIYSDSGRACVLDFNPLRALHPPPSIAPEAGNEEIVDVVNVDEVEDNGDWEDEPDEEEEPDVKIKVVGVPTTLRSQSFAERVETRLPYRLARLNVKHVQNGFMIDEENIVVVKSRPPRKLSFLSF